MTEGNSETRRMDGWKAGGGRGRLRCTCVDFLLRVLWVLTSPSVSRCSGVCCRGFERTPFPGPCKSGCCCNSSMTGIIRSVRHKQGPMVIVRGSRFAEVVRSCRVWERGWWASCGGVSRASCSLLDRQRLWHQIAVLRAVFVVAV